MAVIKLQVIVVVLMLFLCAVLVDGQRGERRKNNRDRERGGRNRAQVTTTAVPLPVLAPPQPMIPCSERSSCSADITKTFYQSNCFCDDLCDIYDDCCEDFMRTSVKPLVKITKKMATCTRNREINPGVEVYIVDNCPKDFDDSYVKMNCETDSHLATDQFLNFPVSGDVSKILYKNYYCAVCAGEALEEISFWHVKVGCGEMPSVDNVTDSVAIIEATLQGSGSSACGLEYFHPRHEARKCKSNMDRCLASWKGNKKVAKKCKRGPVSYVYAGLNVFKNKFCAQCCNVNDTYLTCIDPRTPPPLLETEEELSGPLIPPFAIILDVNSGMGSMLEMSPNGDIENTQTVDVRQCPADHIYDPFVQSCRRLRCSPGMEFQGGVCVPTDYFATPPLPPIDPLDPNENPSVGPEEPDKVERINLDGPVDYSEDPLEYDTIVPVSDSSDERIAHYDDMIYATPEAEPEPVNPVLNNQDGARPEYYDLQCPTMVLNSSQYFILSNKSAYVAMMNEAIPEDLYVVMDDSQIVICIPDDWNENKTRKEAGAQLIMFQFTRYQDLMSFVGLIISLTALMIHFIVYMMLPPLRDTPGKCIISLAVALWLAQALFLAGDHLIDLPLACLIVSAAMHYAFLAAFFWLNVLAIDICHTFNSSNIGSPSHVSGGSCRFACYSLYAWILPGVIVGGSVAMDLLDITLLDPYRPHYAVGLCWLTHRMALLYLFAVPVGAILLLNFVLFIAASCQLCRLMRANKLATHESKERSRLFLYVKLTFIMGLTWLFAYLAAWLELWYLWYVFISFNMLQGVFICFAFVCTRNVLKLLKESGRVHRSTDRGYYGNSSSRTTALHSGYARQTYLYDGGEAKVISQETSI